MCPVPLTLLVINLILLLPMSLIIADAFVGTPLGTSNHCFVSCVLHVEQSVLEYSDRSTVFQRHRTNWDSICSTVRSFTCSTILKSADTLVPFNRAIGEVIVYMFIPLF